MKFDDKLVDDFILWMREEGLRFFKHLKGLTGTYSPVLKLNQKRKGIPVYPVHLRDGMQIRNWMRRHESCKNWTDNDFDDKWVHLVDCAIKKKMKQKLNNFV